MSRWSYWRFISCLPALWTALASVGLAADPAATPQSPPAVAPSVKSPTKPALPAASKPAKPTQHADAPNGKDAPPPLDIAGLEKRLKETDAIGIFTKLTLKNQVDDLLNRFRDHYQGRIKTPLKELRQPYELLLLKVISLLQDGDPPLAQAIVASREAIWAILSDPQKFASLESEI